MDGPHVCQRCSGTFVLASSLRTHAAHVHGEGLQAFLAESSCHPSGGSGNHGDTIDDVKPDKIKREICGTDCEADIAKFSASSATDSQEQVVGSSNGHCESVDGSHSCNHGDTTCDIKPDMIKAEICDYDVDSVLYNTLVRDKQANVGGNQCGKHYNISSGTRHDTVGGVSDVKADMVNIEICDYEQNEVGSIQYNSLVTDKQEHVGGDLYGKHNSSSGTHFDTCGDVKPDMEKIEVCDYEVDSVQFNTLVTDKETYVNDISHKVVSENTQLALHSPEADVPEKGALTQTSNQISTCEASGKTFNTHRGSNSPERIHTGDKSHVCNDCGKGFKYPYRLKRHERTCTGDRRYACNVCEKRFKRLFHLKDHEIIHTEDRPYACSVCEKRFKRLFHLKRHERIHTGDRPYACKVCEKRFKQLYDLKRHEHAHTGDKPYACNVCEKRFKRLFQLKRHEILTGHRPYVYKCNVCEKSFKLIRDLKRHEIIHTGDKLYACNVCEKSFNILYSLKKHERIHTGDRPYACNVCEKRFKQISSLKTHGRIHTGEKPYACNFCEKRFNNLNSLQTHKRNHTGEMPYACNVCEKRFKQHSHLKKHETIHNGDRPYACDICEKRFKQISNLRKHESIHTTCSTPFMLTSSLRTHAADAHREGLTAESSCLPSGGSGNHGDTIGGVNPDKIKRGICGTDYEANIAKSSASQEQVVGVGISNGHCTDYVDGSHSGNHGDTTCDIKPYIIKAETCDYEADSGQYIAMVTDKREHAGGDLCGKHYSSSSETHLDSGDDRKPDAEKIELCDCDYEVDNGHHNSLVKDKEAHGGCDLCGKHHSSSSCTCSCRLETDHLPVMRKDFQPCLPFEGALVKIITLEANPMSATMCETRTSPHERIHTVGDVKPDVDKIEVCDCVYEVDRVHRNTSGTDKETYVNDIRHKVVAENTQLASHSPEADVPEKGALTQTSNQINTCEARGKTFNTHLGSNSPERIHTGDKSHVCNDCGKGFKYPSRLKKHERIHNGDYRPYACKTCEESFKYFSDLKGHERTHTGDRPHACNICEKSFKHPSDLKRHERIHTGDRPYACKICKKCFNRRPHLKAHERIHTGDRPYACKICEKNFNHLSHLKKHERTHTGDKSCHAYACKICEKGFNYFFDLKKHERIHDTGDKRFACKVCEKRFTRLYTLKAHERIHTGVKPYSCPVCEKRFTQLSNLKVHERIHTGDRPSACNAKRLPTVSPI